MEKAPYTSDMRMRDLIADNSLLLMAISRFGMPLRLANRTIAEIGAETGVDAGTFLCVANMVSGRRYDVDSVDLATLMVYLKRAHIFFLDFFLPTIRRKLISALDYARSHDTALIILRFFDESDISTPFLAAGLWTGNTVSRFSHLITMPFLRS